jgi:hypothetical protein
MNVDKMPRPPAGASHPRAENEICPPGSSEFHICAVRRGVRQRTRQGRARLHSHPATPLTAAAQRFPKTFHGVAENPAGAPSYADRFL